MIIYILYLCTIGRPRHPVRKNMAVVRSGIWRHYKDYFPVRLVIPRATRRRFDRQKNYLFGYHPHGIHTFGAISCFGSEANDFSKLLPGIRVHLQTLGVNYYIPFWAYLMSIIGAGDASAACLRATLRAGPGESVALVVGGAEESLVAQPNRNDLVLHKRKGFIKIALQEGASLVPVYGFGENSVYDIPRLSAHPVVQRGLRLLKRATGFTIPLIAGRGFFLRWGLMPHRRPIVVVVGEPLDLPQVPQPTPEVIDYWQERYIAALEKLYAEHKGVYDLEATGLRITK
ncbi:2-acylglycerol O-acyltransferase 2 [Strigomonas culicis]|nr:2-acylglycerol O-acyltransferase 2 [Strigomonas culicis]|eukprot:EPY27166.1 2-acylglycerol O-acyltransferase 2 [Strigomonas culicis]